MGHICACLERRQLQLLLCATERGQERTAVVLPIARREKATAVGTLCDSEQQAAAYGDAFAGAHREVDQRQALAHVLHIQILHEHTDHQRMRHSACQQMDRTNRQLFAAFDSEPLHALAVLANDLHARTERESRRVP